MHDVVVAVESVANLSGLLSGNSLMRSLFSILLIHFISLALTLDDGQMTWTYHHFRLTITITNCKCQKLCVAKVVRCGLSRVCI